MVIDHDWGTTRTRRSLTAHPSSASFVSIAHALRAQLSDLICRGLFPLNVFTVYIDTCTYICERNKSHYINLDFMATISQNTCLFRQIMAIIEGLIFGGTILIECNL